MASVGVEGAMATVGVEGVIATVGVEGSSGALAGEEGGVELGSWVGVLACRRRYGVVLVGVLLGL